MLTALAALAVVVGFVYLVGCVGSAITGILRIARGGAAPTDRPRLLMNICVKLVGAGGLAASPVVALSIAEGRTGWVDGDGNGMLDGFENGSYDWVDINGGSWIRTTGLLVVVVVTLMLVALAAVDRFFDAADRP